jgi:hypothetical protein
MAMSDEIIPFDSIQPIFDAQGAGAGLDVLIEKLRAGGNPHALFRALLLKKRSDLGLPLINPGDLSSAPSSARKEYEAYVETACHDTGAAYLKDGKIVDAWRYFRTVGDRTVLREAIEKLNPQAASDEVLNIALDEGVHPKRGFEIVLARDGLCRAITLFEQARSADLEFKRHAAGLLAGKLYAELVVGVSKQIFERFGEVPPETDLVELIRHRPWLFENAKTDADPSHISAVSRVGLLSATEPQLLMSLSISEYGRKLDRRHGAATEPPFEAGYDDHARYARALLGENVDETIDYFTAKLVGYETNGADLLAAEWVISLIWRAGKRKRALELWSQYLSEQMPEAPGTYLPSFYDLCTEAGEFGILAEMARKQGDITAWAGACMMSQTKK